MKEKNSLEPEIIYLTIVKHCTNFYRGNFNILTNTLMYFIEINFKVAKF